VAALLEHAAFASSGPGSITLTFGSRTDADRAEKGRAEIEPVVSGILGQTTRITFAVGESSGQPDSGAEADAADRKSRETEARQHPMIRRAQDVFGASLKEIKT
jgi:hypothetical protein